MIWQSVNYVRIKRFAVMRVTVTILVRLLWLWTDLLESLSVKMIVSNRWRQKISNSMSG